MYNLGCRTVEVIEIRTHKGKGTKEEPGRYFRQYWSKEGEYLCEVEEKAIVPCFESNGKTETLSWDEEEPMTKEFALAVVGSIRRFIKARYYHPGLPAFNGWPDFRNWLNELAGLEQYIERN